VIAGAALLAAATTLKLWPGYTIDLPPGHCVNLSRGPDFDTLSFRAIDPPSSPFLIGLYAGHNPEEPKCPKPAKKTWGDNDLSFTSVRGGDGCAEFSVRDPKTPERGFLHLWYGPAAKDHASLAEGVLSSIRPAPLPIYRPDDLPKCK